MIHQGVRNRIPVAEPDLSGREVEFTTDAIAVEGRISSSGKYLDLFEKKCRESFDRKYALSVSNGTTALHLALLALGVGSGDEVIVPSYTFAATAAAVAHCGATPVFTDVNEEEWTVTLDDIKNVYTTKTKAVISVDIYGVPCRYDEIESWCEKVGIALIEDAAEAHGAIYHGQKVGSFGTISCFSFYGNKILTTGEGGVCVTDDAGLAESMRILKSHGMKVAGSYIHDVVGYNYRLTNVQAAIGCAQFERFDDFIEKRRKIVSIYKENLSTCGRIIFQKTPEDSQPAPWLFSILIKDVDVNKVSTALSDLGIDSRPFFRPLHDQEAYKKYVKPGQDFSVSDRLRLSGISLPTSTTMTFDEVKYICESLIKILS